jgi:hypothetical protein
MKTAKELRDSLSEVFTGLRDGSVDPRVAQELANIAGKMISSAKAQLEQAELRKESPDIAFLREPNAP